MVRIVRLDALILPVEADTSDVDRELRRRFQTQRGTTTGAGAKRRGPGLIKAGAAGAVAGALVGAATQNEAVNALVELLMSIAAAILLPLAQALLPVFEALAPLAVALVDVLLPALIDLGKFIISVIEWMNEKVPLSNAMAPPEILSALGLTGSRPKEEGRMEEGGGEDLTPFQQVSRAEQERLGRIGEEVSGSGYLERVSAAYGGDPEPPAGKGRYES